MGLGRVNNSYKMENNLYNVKWGSIPGRVKIVNLGVDFLKVEFVHLESNYSLYSGLIGRNKFVGIDVKEKEIDLYITLDNKDIVVYHIKGDQIILKDYSVDFDFNKPITFVGGHTGGGTSIVMKALRYRGVYVGEDAGNQENRKTHESQSFRACLYALENTQDISSARNLFNKLLGSYEYKEGIPNLVKFPPLGKVSLLVEELFLNSKFISVIKEQNKFFSTGEGREFNTKDPLEVLNIQKFNLEGSPVFHLKFRDFFVDYNYFNKVLKYIGSNNFIKSDEEFSKLKQDIDFNEKVLQ